MATVYFAGLPVKPDVEKLMKKYSGLKVGDKIPYVDIEQEFGVGRKTYRWSCVVRKWRERLEAEQHICLACERNSHFFVCAAPQRVHGVAMGYNRRAIRNLTRSYTVAAHTNPDELDELGKMTRDMILKTSATAANQLTTDRKCIMAINRPIKKLAS